MKGRESEGMPVYTGPDGRAVQSMFADIAHRYDFLNHFLSVSIDRYWRKAAVRKLGSLIHAGPSARCLDLCSGTGDLALDLHRRLQLEMVASDFCHPMLTRSLAKTASRGFQKSVRTVEADTLFLPFQDESFDAVTIGFGLRNLEDPVRGLTEMRRVLRSNGCVLILEFSKPVVPVLRHGFNFYFRHILPRLGAAISGNQSAYQYLPDSVMRFPSQEGLSTLMRSVGFAEVDYQNLTGGIAALHWGRKTSVEIEASRKVTPDRIP
jgi:demethylmenaquinone methyltransferase/2-methoxy-6-polyprenyl-1,4-benzoquinol methylase